METDTQISYEDKEIKFCKNMCGNDSPCMELCNDFKTTFNYL